jgi:hypothetical protein
MASFKNLFALALFAILIPIYLLRTCGNSEESAQKRDNFEQGQQALWDKDYKKGINYLRDIPESDPNYNKAKELIEVAENALNAQGETQINNDSRPIAKLTDEEYVKYFQEKWDSIELYQERGIPQYKTYWDELGKVLEEISPILEQDSSLSKLKKLESKLDGSKKIQEARTDYVTYGQPSYGTLIALCQDYLQNNLNDPESLEIEDKRIDGRTKKGWNVIIKYRATNGFGALTLHQTKFDIRFNMIGATYQVANVYE